MTSGIQVNTILERAVNLYILYRRVRKGRVSKILHKSSMSRGCDGFVLENDGESDELIASIWPDNFIVKLLYKITVNFLFVLVGMPYLNRILITFKSQISNHGRAMGSNKVSNRDDR